LKDQFIHPLKNQYNMLPEFSLSKHYKIYDCDKVAYANLMMLDKSSIVSLFPNIYIDLSCKWQLNPVGVSR